MDQPSDYRPVSPLAVAALLLGCCSAVAVFTRATWFVPLVGVLTATVALAEVSRPLAARVGRLPALAGLALSLGFGAQAVTQAVAGRWIDRTRAIVTAETWIDAVCSDRLNDALAASSPSILQPTAGPGAEEHADRAARLAELPAVRTLAEGAPAVTSAWPLGSDDKAWGVNVAVGNRTVTLVVIPRSNASARGVVERWTIASAGIQP